MDRRVLLAIIGSLALFFILMGALLLLSEKIQQRRRERRDRELTDRLANLQPRRREPPPTAS